MMKLKLLSAVLVAALLLLMGPIAVAQGINDDFCAGGGGGTEVCNQGSSSNPFIGADGLLTKVVGFFALITGIVSVIIIILMALRYVSSNGDAGKAASARQGIIYAIAGLIVALLAQGIVMFVLSKL